jgi:endonuclease YncB( thermonuclease family)
MPSGWEKAPEYGSRGGWFSNAAAIAAVIAVSLALANCSVEAAKERQADQAAATAEPNQIVGVASVVDGDTIEIHNQRIRLSGYDTPESGARCGQTNVYQSASLALSDFIANRTVSCVPTGTDQYDRVTATCSVGGTDLGEYVVSQGWGRDWPRYSNGAYADEEATARAARRGLWGLQCPADLWGDRDYSNN